ncbi:LOW QUALITY PROTEIN: hypothetical protein PHMEG_00041362, partial [Phytophthora megakarya]
MHLVTAFRPFIAYDAVEPFDTSLSLDKRRAWWDKSTETSVERYLRLKQEARETPRTFLWRLNAAATKANVDYHSTSGSCRHVNQFLKNLQDRDLQLSLQGRVYFTTDELEDVLKQVEEMEQGMRRKPANDYDEENDEAYDGLVDQEEVFRAEVPGSWNDRNGRPQGRPDSRSSGHSGAPDPPFHVPCATSSGTPGNA